VIGDHYWAAKKGLEALKIGWNTGPNAKNSSAAMWTMMKHAAGNGKPVMGRMVGDLDTGMKNAHSTLDAVYALPMLAHATMEPINTTVHVRPDGCEIWVGTQVPTAAQAAAAAAAGVPVERVTINNQLIGGGFGRRLAVDSITQAVLFAKQVSYPIKVIWSREQDTRHDHFRPAYYDRISCGLGSNGLPVAWAHRTTGASVLGDYLPTGFPEGQLDSDAVEGSAEPPYDFPVLRVDWVRTKSPVKVNWWRGVGPTHNVFVVESFMDEVAHSLDRDPVEYRRALLKKNPRALGVLNLVAEKAGWGSPLPPGVGRGISLHDSFGSYLALVVEAEVTPAGTVKLRRLVAAVDCGININPNSVMAQVEGGTIFGLSAALYNGITLTNGAVDQGNFNDYRQMRIDEVPPFEVHIVPSRESPGGLGECGTVSAAPALGNAIFAATGQRLRALPFQPLLLADKGTEKRVIAGMVPVGLGALALAAAASAPKHDDVGEES
jgi:isoquinoline 1-oxidoreductase beta subunit